MTPNLAFLRRIVSILVGAAAITAIFAAAALLGALVANATSSAPPANGRLAFAGVSYGETCWSQAVASDDFGERFARVVNVCE
ncbi:hypothetical protein [Methylopila sp. M107]|uniref:hypothetical protein n=1 Tax=Methylopila sp. M107 TaxID=1101190 RepID=UPI0003A1357C|nr:hypothetical protein [Methylopila sp. M107]